MSNCVVDESDLKTPQQEDLELEAKKEEAMKGFGSKGHHRY